MVKPKDCVCLYHIFNLFTHISVLVSGHQIRLTSVVEFAIDFRKDFTAYAEVCFKEFGDRVMYWTTINEANIFAIGGYDIGITPPGRCSPPFGVNCSRGNSSTEPYIVVHNMLLAHSSAMKLYRGNYKV